MPHKTIQTFTEYTMDKLFVPLVIVSQIFAIAILVLLGIWTGVTLGGFAWDGSMKHFNFHPLLMVLGMVILNGDGILVFRLFPMFSKYTSKLIHLILQGIVVIMGGIALKAVFALVFAYQNANNWDNVHTVHSWVGFTTYLMFGLQWICGFLIFFFPKLSEDYRGAYMPLHRYFGVALFALAIVSAISGIQEEIMFHTQVPKGRKYNDRQLIGDIMGLVIVAFALIIGYLVTNKEYQRKEKSLENDDEKQPLAGTEMKQTSSGSIQAADP
ncbi:transmembrane ascorbate-dependent reductase CYB561-like [Amphiura filiformis]|uniref:transmembrane ascorbate-dependent reductase CYB561-like n=1 Tax=Amphiura filiformis TaxID=82378 RepID=UPI003B211B59